MGYIGGHGAEDKKRQAMLSKPKYFEKSFEKSSKTRSKIPHTATKATPQELETLKRKLKIAQLKTVGLYLFSLLLTTVVAYLLYRWIFE